MKYATPNLVSVGTAAALVRTPDFDLPDNAGEAAPGNIVGTFTGLDD